MVKQFVISKIATAANLLTISQKIAPRKIVFPNPNPNASPKPNPDPDRGAIFLGGNFPDTALFSSVQEWLVGCF